MRQPLGVFDLTNEEYHASEGISRTKLWKFKQLPYKYWHEYLSGDFEEKKSSRPFFLGSLVHTLVLEPHLFEKEYCMKPVLEELPPAVLLKDVVREVYEQIKKARAEISARNNLKKSYFQENLAKKSVVSEDDLVLANGMRNSVMSNEIATDIMHGAKFEKSIYWEHKSTGLICKARPDIWGNSITADLKTVLDAGYRGFQGASYKDGYFLQAGMIFEALNSIGQPFDKFVFICVEKSAPYSIGIYVLDDEALQFGREMFDSLMIRLAECYDKNIWPDYGIQKLCVPKYASLEMEIE